MLYRLLPITILLCLTHCLYSQDWKLVTDKDGIKTFSRPVPGSKISALKIESGFDASASQLVAVILDINACADWLYSTKSCATIKTISPSELYYYSEIRFPWPTANRDFVSHLKVSQDAATKNVTIRAENVSLFVPEKKGIVRIKESIGKWTIRPITKNKVHVVYELQVDPGGGLPAWLVNMLSEKGPLESFKNLRGQVKKPAYTNARFSFIAE